LIDAKEGVGLESLVTSSTSTICADRITGKTVTIT